MQLEIVFEDYYLLVLNKPQGIPSDAANPAQTSVKSLVLEHLKKQHPGRNKHHVGIPHRLDKPVGGLMVVTKTPQALKHVSKQFSDHTVLKIYLGIFEGNVRPDHDLIRQFISRNETGKKAIISNTASPDFKPCSLSYTVIEKTENYTVAQVELHTGKYHQIRAQMSFKGNPVAGDTLYEARPIKTEGICLWSVHLEFIHPKSSEKLTFRLDTKFASAVLKSLP